MNVVKKLKCSLQPTQWTASGCSSCWGWQNK